MRFLVISDIHANLEALETALSSAGEWDATLCLGDLVGYGPNPNECVDRVRQLPNLTCIIGNHDEAALGRIDLDTFNGLAKEAAIWTQKTMKEETRGFLESLSQVEELDGFTAVHGSPRDPVWEYLDQLEQAPESFARFTTQRCFVGHTHVPRVFTQKPETLDFHVYVPTSDGVLETDDGIRRIINPGSVGQPRDGDPRAAFGIFDTSTGELRFHRHEYDVPAVQTKMKEVGLPDPLAERLSYGF